MKITRFLLPLAATTLLVTSCKQDSICTLNDNDCDGVPDDLGQAVDRDSVAGPDPWRDGYGVDLDCDGEPDAVGLDTNDDGFVDSIDLQDGSEIIATGSSRAVYTDCSGGGDGDASGGGPGAGGTDSGAGGAPTFNTGGSGNNDSGGGCLLGDVIQSEGPTTTERYYQRDVTRNGTNYKFIANGWGDNWGSHTISIAGTSFDVQNFQGSEGPNYAPAGYPTVYCGDYSNTGPSGACGLPAPISSISTLQTGLRWSHPGGGGQYNVAYDVWLGNSGSHSGFFMVWLHDPAGQQPAGSVQAQNVTVASLPGVWNIWTGHVNGLPIINYVRPEGQDSMELAFDLMDFFDDATSRNITIPGNEIRSVAIGFEIWNGPVSGLKAEDFCVQVN